MSDYPEPQFVAAPEGLIGYVILGDGPIDLVFVPSWVWNVEIMWEEPRIE